jgi:hypothetical protein
MERRCLREIGLIGMLIAANGASAAPQALCHPQERVVFSCPANQKTISLCASGDLRGTNGHLVYRFGKDLSHVELAYGASPASSPPPFSFDYSSWAKGESSAVSFNRGTYRYIINHAHGAFGVDGGPNVAGVQVLLGKKKIADISCNEPKATDNIYQELHGANLPFTGAL